MENDIYANQKYIYRRTVRSFKLKVWKSPSECFMFLMPDLRLKNQNIDLPSISSTYYVTNDVQQQRILNLDDQASSSCSRATTTVTGEESIVEAESNIPAVI